MPKTPPERIDPVTAAEKGRSFEGSVPIARMQRLSTMLVEHSGEAFFRVQFGREGGIGIVRGSVTAELTLECQCCLAPLKLPVQGEFALGIVSSIEQGKSLPESLEALLVDEGGDISIIEMIEDELLLATPHVPQHPVCMTGSARAASGASSDGARAFAELSSLVKSNKSVG